MEQDRAEPGEFDYEDPNLEEKLVNVLKAQGIFDQFRKDCLSDVDTKPAYQNLRVRVDKSVSSYLGKTTWRPSLNKNQLRNQLRRHIQDLSGMGAGVERIGDQIVNPKLNSTFLPEVEEVIYKCFGKTKSDEMEDDLVNGNDEAVAGYSNQNGANNHEDFQAGKISARNLSAISSEAELLNMEEVGSSSSSPGPGLAGHVSPLTPGASPSVNQGDISPLTPANTPPPPQGGTPPPPPPGEEARTEEVAMEVDVEEERPGSAYTPPLPPMTGPETPSYTPPPAASPLPPPPPPPPESGGEASMSSISDTDLGDVSPPRPAPPAQETEAVSGSPGSGSDEDLQQLMKMKAELMAQLEGDFKLSPEESDEEEDDLVQSGDNREQAPKVSTTAPAGAAALSSTSGSPSPPPAKVTPPGEEMAKLSVEDPAGCKPFSPPESKSPSSGDDGAGPRASGSYTAPSAPSGSASTGAAATGSGQNQQGGGGGGEEHQKTQSRHSHSHHHHHHSHSSSSKSRHSSSSHSREEKKKYDRKELKEKAKIEKAKIEKYEQKIKSKDKLKSDKYQDLDIFSNTKKLGTLHLPTVRSQSSSSGSSTPNTPKTHKKEFEKKLDEQIRKELERREEKRKERHHSDKHFKTPVRIEERRDSSDKERSSEKKERRSSKDDRHDSHSSRSRHDSDRKHKDRRHSSSSSSSSSGEKKEKDRRSSTEWKYSKEREQQEMESKRRLQDARLRREREEKEKSRSHEKEKQAKDGEMIKHAKVNSSKEREKSNPKPDDDLNVLLKEKINSLGVDNIQKMLMESLVEKAGAKVSDKEKQTMMAKMENIIKEKKPPATKKLPVSKPSPKKKSGRTSSSSSALDSDDEIKEMKVKMKKSKAGPVSRPVRKRKVRKFEEEEDKSDSDGDFVAPVVTEETKTPTVVKFMKKNVSPVGQTVLKKTDDDPDMPDFHCFDAEDVKKSERISEKLNEFIADEGNIDIGEITETDINDAIPPSRLVVVDLEEGSDPGILIEKLAQFGGNPRLTTPVPDWLNPYLKGAKVKIEDVEMPTIEEVRQHLVKKKTGKRKRAGWDIVVDWVPQEQPAGKRSKIEKELGFDFDSSFGCSLSVAEGRRSRRSTTTTSKLNTSQDQQTVVKEEEKTKPDPEIEENVKTDPVSTSPDSPAAAEDRAEVDLEKASAAEEGSPSKKRRSKDIIAAYLTSAGVERNLMEADENTKVLAMLDEKIKDAELELKSVIKTLQQSKNKRKRAASGDNKFHGWGSSEAKKVKKAAYDSNGSPQLHLDAAGARFGLTEFDFVKLDTDQTVEEPLLQVIFSPPMLRDLKKLESSPVSGITPIQPLTKADTGDSDQDDRGSHSPDSYGSSKENDPEIVNTVTTTIYKQSKVSSNKKKNNLKNPVLKPQLEVS